MAVLFTLVIHFLVGAAIAYFVKPWQALMAGLVGAFTGLFFTFIFNLEMPPEALSPALTSAGIASFYAALFGYLFGVRHHRMTGNRNRRQSTEETERSEVERHTGSRR